MKTYLCILVFFHFNVFFPKKQCSSTPLEPGPSLLRPSETCWLSRLAKKASFSPSILSELILISSKCLTQHFWLPQWSLVLIHQEARWWAMALCFLGSFCEGRTKPAGQAVGNLKLIMPRTILPWVIASAGVVALDSYKNNTQTFIAQLGFASLCTCYGFRIPTSALGGPGDPFGALHHSAVTCTLHCALVGVFFEEENCFPQLILSFDMGRRW